jgi:hypothetical protein
LRQINQSTLVAEGDTMAIGTVRQHMDNNEGKLPPGMTHSFFKRLNIKRS